jgi:hypothetical protein
MSPLNECDPELACFSTTELWEWAIERMETGLAAGDDHTAPAAPFHIAKLLFDEIVRRNPDWNCAEIAEFRTILELALAGKGGWTGHA